MTDASPAVHARGNLPSIAPRQSIAGTGSRTMRPRHELDVGCDLLIDADLPPGGGLSSSSALVVGFAAVVARLHDLVLERRELAEVGRDAEHWYGTTGGIMDQFVISHARAGQA